MCGIAGYNLTERSAVAPTAAARILLAGIAERGADAAGYAHRNGSMVAHVHKQRSGASALLARVEVPEDTSQLLVHVRDYTKGHPRIEANNHPVRHGAVVGVHNGIIVNDEDIFAQHGWSRDRPEMSVDSEAIFALAEAFDGAAALEPLRGSMATAWIDERRPELFVARGVGRPLFIGYGAHETFFASTTRALELLERYLKLELEIREVPEGTHLTLAPDGEITRQSFQPDSYVEETPLPPVRAPHEGARCLRILPGLV